MNGGGLTSAASRDRQPGNRSGNPGNPRRPAPRLPPAAGLLLPAAALLCGLAAAPVAAQTVTLSVPPGTSLAEGAGSTDIAVTATLSAALDADTTITLTLGGEARSTDYTVDALPSITIPAQQTTGQATVVLSPVDDIFYEQRYETVTIDGSATGLTVTGVSLDLLSDETDRPRLGVRGVNVLRLSEGETQTATVLVTLLGGVLEDALSGSVFLEYRATGGEAPETRIGTTPALPAVFTIAAGSTSTTMAVEFRHPPNSALHYFAVASVHASADFLGATSKSPQES